MGARSRLMLLMLTAILGRSASNRPPGGPTGAPDDDDGPATANCPEDQEPSDTKAGNLYWCEDHRIWFDVDGNIQQKAGSLWQMAVLSMSAPALLRRLADTSASSA